MSERNQRRWVRYLVVSLWFGWCFFWAASSDRLVHALSRHIPAWVIMFIWASCLVLIPISILSDRLDTPQMLRVAIAVSVFIFWLLLPIAARLNWVAATLVGVVLIIEQFWWSSRRKSSGKRA